MGAAKRQSRTILTNGPVEYVNWSPELGLKNNVHNVSFSFCSLRVQSYSPGKVFDILIASKNRALKLATSIACKGIQQ